MNKFTETLNSGKPVLVDFYAEWCYPCKVMKPILEEVKHMVGENAKILKVDIDQNRAVSAEYNIQSVPTLILFKNGKPVFRQSGVVPAEQLKRIIEQNS